MQTVFGTPVTGSNKLNCTANDIRLSKAVTVSPTSCVENTEFTLTATFETNVTANGRYDAGFFFRTDGVGNARGGNGGDEECSLSALDAPLPLNNPVLNLDSDSCGDLNAGTHLVTFTIPNVTCVAAPGTDRVRLPNCTSWHSSKATACSIDDPLADPFGDSSDFAPDTKSKCVCDDNFTVPVVVKKANISAEKTPFPTAVPEPGGVVTFVVVITNEALDASVVIDSLVDDPGVGDLLDMSNTDVITNDCPDLFGEVLAPGESRSCEFTAEVFGEFGDEAVEETVKACVEQDQVAESICADASSEVAITDASTPPTLTSTATGTANCQLDATYAVVVKNNSTIDALDVTALSDDIFGDLTTVHGDVVSTTCSALPVTIAKGGEWTCSFVGRIRSNSCDFSHTNKVTGQVTDEDGVSSAPSDVATVSAKATL